MVAFALCSFSGYVPAASPEQNVAGAALAAELRSLRPATNAHFSGVLRIRKADGRMMFNPPAETAVQGGDFLIVMGRPDNLRSLETLLAGAPGARPAGR